MALAIQNLPTGVGIQNLPGVGVQAKSPAQNQTPRTNTLNAGQTAPKDLSGTYANVNGTIYNKTSGKAFSTPQEFFGESGVNSFNNLKFDTAWQPSSNNTGAGIAPATNTPQGLSLGGGIQTPSVNTATPVNPPLTTATGATQGYTPPNAGTTGVSQGGIIGNLIQNAQSNPALTTANQNLQALQGNYAQATAI